MTTAHVTVAVSHMRLPSPHLHLLGLEHYLQQVHIPAVAVVLSLAGALCYGVSSILQQQAAAAQPDESSLRLSLLVRLARSRRWMLGNLCDVGGFLFQFFALRSGALALVSPLFVMALAFSIIGNALVQHRRPTRMEWFGSAATVVGLSVFVGVAEPGPGYPHASAFAWSMLFLATTVLCGTSIGLSQGSARRRAFMLAVASGILYGVTAAVTEYTSHGLSKGLFHLLLTWSPYALAIVSIVGMLINQSAYQAGDLRLSLPILTVLEPIVAIVIGQFLFGEHISGAPVARVFEVAGLVAMVAGVFCLAQSVDDEPAPIPPGPPASPHGAAPPVAGSPAPSVAASDGPMAKDRVGSGARAFRSRTLLPSAHARSGHWLRR